MKCLMCKKREAIEGVVFCRKCQVKVFERVEKIRKAKQDKELKKVLAYVYNRTMQFLKCDVCGRWYLGKFDSNTIGEPNVCCDHCAWVLSHESQEIQPPYTCKPIFDAWLLQLKFYSCLIWHCLKCCTLNVVVNERHPLQCEKCGVKP